MQPARTRSLFRTAALGALALALGPVHGLAQATIAARVAAPGAIDVERAPRPEAEATRTETRIVVDGVPDEGAWRAAPVLTDFIQTVPDLGMPATEKTVVRVLYDDEHLYISAVLYDSNMRGLTIPSLEQDFQTHDSDVFGITIDTYLDRRNAFMFLVNPGGALKDGQVYDNSRNYNIPWEGVLALKTAVSDSAWTVEMSIPFTTLRFDPAQPVQDWGFQFSRRVRRKSEDSYWSPLARRELLHKMSRAGTIKGFRDLRAGRNLTVKPYATATDASGSLTRSGAGQDGFDGGVDVKYGITSRLTADLTFQTDFSQVEVDQERVNLTRFSLFFPEKRDFFLENSGTFAYGDVTERNVRMGSSLRDFTLFHSRRIGLDDRGIPIPILGGGRVTGQAGGWGIGLLQMQTRDRGELAGESFSVARLRRNILGDSDVGAVFVNRQATDGSGTYNRSYGMDANVHLLGGMIVNTYLAATRASDAGDGDQWAGRVSAAWRDKLWDASAFVKQVGKAFHPGLGFVRRSGIRQTYLTFGAHPVPASPKIQEVNPYGEFSYITNPDGLLLTRNARAGLGVSFQDGSSLTATHNRRFERLERDFLIRGFTVPVGGYSFSESQVKYQSNAGLPFSGSLGVTRGGYFDGDRTSLNLGALWRVNRHLAFDLFADRNSITLPEGSFTADVYGGRVNWALSTRFFTTAFVQYNAETDEVFTNVRLNFIHAPLSDLFLVYTERRDAGGGGVIDRLFSFKVTQLLSF
jgi:Domain of unknown function (DUF5916)/Carbohydrate family 9 binding domain-like